MSDSAGRKVTSHPFEPCSSGMDHCDAKGCGQPESAHRSAPQPLDTWNEQVRVLPQGIPAAAPDNAEPCQACGATDWDSHPPDCPFLLDHLPRAAPDNVEDRLRTKAVRIHSDILGCYDRHPFACEACDRLHAALEAVVREEREACAKLAHGSDFVDGPQGTIEGQIAAAIRARGLEEKP